MAYKQFKLGNGTPVTIYKRKTSRSLRLTVAADGQVKVSIPTWAPYKSGLQFAESRREWIRTQRRPAAGLTHGQAIGKAHRLQFVSQADAPTGKVTSRLKMNAVIVSHPSELSSTDPVVQRIAQAAGIRALRKQAEALLPKRVEELAARHDFTYQTVTIKQMRSRWGSCDQHKNIVLNLFLVQLPWDLIDYVLLHELTHTEVLRHGPDFWQAMERLLPNAKQLRRRMRDHQPTLSAPTTGG